MRVTVYGLWVAGDTPRIEMQFALSAHKSRISKFFDIAVAAAVAVAVAANVDVGFGFGLLEAVTNCGQSKA